MRMGVLIGLATLLPAMAGATQLQAPAVACLSLRDAKTYAETRHTQPEFAADLLARAACYPLAGLADARALGRPSQGFQQYHLLSGHKVWLPVAAAQTGR